MYLFVKSLLGLYTLFRMCREDHSENHTKPNWNRAKKKVLELLEPCTWLKQSKTLSEAWIGMTVLFIGQHKWVWLFKEAGIWGGMFVKISFILKVIYSYIVPLCCIWTRLCWNQDSHQIIKKHKWIKHNLWNVFPWNWMFALAFRNL